MRHAVLADTGPLYAAADATDQYHSRAIAEQVVFARLRLQVVVAVSTVLEWHALIL